MIYTRYSKFIQAYHSLEDGDVYLGNVPSSHLKAAMLADLTARKVRLIPSAAAQMINASKVAQAFILNPWMIPLTTAVVRRKQLLDAVTAYGRENIEAVITKADRLHCGHGIRKWDSPEMMYACLGLDNAALPFVLQPFVERFIDLRVIVVDNYCEAYVRTNPHNLRMNLSTGGQSQPHPLTDQQTDLCRKLMRRAQMPYAHIDLMLTPDGSTYLSEIRLSGGIQGARISRAVLERKKQRLLMALARQAAPESEV
jgi:ribosomal protein S6--L-glutamate ligase